MNITTRTLAAPALVIAVIVAVALLLSTQPVGAGNSATQSSEPVPHIVFGLAFINEQQVPPGNRVVATVAGEVVGSAGTQEGGQFELVLSPPSGHARTVVFTVAGYTTNDTTEWINGQREIRDLNVTIGCPYNSPEPETTSASPNSPPPVDFYRAQGLPELFNSPCSSPDRANIGIEYTHSLIPAGDREPDLDHARGKYGERLQRVASDGSPVRLYSYEYYARGLPGEVAILINPAPNSSTRGNGCLFGVLTNEPLPR